MNHPKYALKSVGNALSLLSMLLQGRALQVSAAAEELNVAPSTAHRLLSMLVYYGYAKQETDMSYRIAENVDRVWKPYLLRDTLLQRNAHSQLLALGDELQETVHLMVLTENDVEFVESVEAQSRVLRVGGRVGTRLPAHQTSGGKAMLAQLRAHEVASLYPDGSPIETYVDLETFQRYLYSIRARGYAVNFEGAERGINAIGACVRSQFGDPRAAVAVSAPTHRLLRSRAPEIGKLVRQYADRLEDSLLANCPTK